MIPFPRRYRYTAVAAAAVIAASLFGVGYLVGASDDQPVRTVAMSGAGARAELDVFDADDAGNWPMELRVGGLATGTYELWLTRGGKLAEPCGAFAVSAGETTVPLNAPYRLRDFDGWVVVRSGRRAVLTTCGVGVAPARPARTPALVLALSLSVVRFPDTAWCGRLRRHFVLVLFGPWRFFDLADLIRRLRGRGLAFFAAMTVPPTDRGPACRRVQGARATH